MTQFSPLRILEVLVRHGVRFVLIGGLAASIRGSPSVTYDLDIGYDRRADNLDRLAAALGELGARLREADEDISFPPDAETLAAGDHFTFTTDAGSLDCLGTPAGTQGFDDLVTGATLADLEGLQVLVASIDDLIRMKRAAGRPKDRVEIEILGALREEVERREI